MTREIAEVVIWCCALGLLVSVLILFRQYRITAFLRKRNAELEGDVRARDEEVRHLAEARLPALADSLHHHPVPVPGLRDAQLIDTPFAQRCQMVLDLFAGVVDRAQKRADQSAKAALKASMRALQGLANEQQISISDMQERHESPDVLRDLLEIDHANSQFGRRAQAIAVLCGSWPGRQRSASHLLDAVRGAKSRIRDYRRVQVRTQIDVAVVSRAVEPVVLAVAELLDNAARHSQPNTTVEVNLQPAHNGACIVIDDAGVGMDAGEVERAGLLLAGQEDVDVTRLGDPPQFGFAVIGVLAARYGFKVSVDTRSPYGGVRAVVFVPSSLLTQIESDDPPSTGYPGQGGAGIVTDADIDAYPRADAALGSAQAPPASSAQPGQEPEEQPQPTGTPTAESPSGAALPTRTSPSGTSPSPGHSRAAAPGGEPAAGQADRDETPAGHGAGRDDGSPAEGGPGAGHRERSAPPDERPAPAAAPAVSAEGATAGGLPKRRRRQATAATQRPDSRPHSAEVDNDTAVRSARETAQRMGAFARGTRSGRAETPDEEGNPQG